MTPLPLLLLPGLDGTARMFAPILGILPGSVFPVPIAYPTDVVLDYRALEAWLVPLLPREPFALLGESFSGPLALRLAARGVEGLSAVVLVASFVRSPVAASRLLRPLVRGALFRAPPPAFVMRRWLLGEDASPAQVGALREAISLVAPEVMAARVREVLGVDATEALRATRVPVLYVAGAHDRLVPPRTAGALRAFAPELEVSVLDAPHLVLQRRPAEAADVVARFLERQGLAAAAPTSR